MAESRPSPLPSRTAPGAPANRNVGSLLQNRGGQRGGATPIPPSLQAKMAAVRSPSPAMHRSRLTSTPIKDGQPRTEATVRQS